MINPLDRAPMNMKADDEEDHREEVGDPKEDDLRVIKSGDEDALRPLPKDADAAAKWLEEHGGQGGP
jgi:hypothetical protein